MTKLGLFRELLLQSDDAAIYADPSLNGGLRIATSGPLTVDYAPFEHIQPNARIVIVGITPGSQQARNALLAARQAFLAGRDEADALRIAKVFASFSGSMRANLIAMLDQIGVASLLELSSTADLWEKHSDLVHFTSALRYPVYLNGKNYSGSPAITSNALLTSMVDQYLSEEAHRLPTAIWVPLGPAAASALERLVQNQILAREHVLFGLPHPSGANAERISYFLGRKQKADLSTQTSATKIDTVRKAIMDQMAQLRAQG